MGFDAGDGRARRPDGRRRRVQAPGAADRQARAADRRRRLPLSAAAARLARGCGRRARPRRRRPVRAARCTWSRRRSATSATSRCGRSRSLRAVPLIAAEDTRLTRRLLDAPRDPTRLVSYHARSGPRAAAAAARAPPGGADLALVTDAGTPPSATRAGSWWRAWAAEGGRVVPIPGASAVLAAVVGARRRRAALGVRGVPAAIRARAARAAGADRRRRARHGPVRGAGADRGDAARPRGGVRRRRAPAAVCRELTKLHEQIVRGPLARARRARRPTARSRPGASSSSSSGVAARRPGSAGRPRPRRARGRPGRGRAARRGGVARGEAANASPGARSRRQLYGDHATQRRRSRDAAGGTTP